MKGEPPKIIVIHDGLEQDEPLLVELRERYGDENVVLEPDSRRGLEYVLSHLTQKIIVLLDLQFKGNEPSGVEVFDRIRDRTSLVYVIVWTANNVPAEHLIKFINKDALALISATDSTERILDFIDKAAHALETRVASVLEQWISAHDEQTKNEPYLTTETGATFSLAEILQEIRKQTTLGMRMERNILLLAVDLLARNKEKIQ